MIYNSEEYGAFSLKWMIKASSLWVPRENLEAAFQAAIEYLDRLATFDPDDEDEDTEPDLALMIDVVTQVLLTGAYVPTRFPDEGETGLYLPDEEGGEPVISEEDIARFKRLLGYVPDGREPEPEKPDDDK